jgi:hypothetical protein
VENKMINIKKIWEENKSEIVTGVILGGMIAGAVVITSKYYTSNFKLIPKGKGLSAIWWKPNGNFITLEEAKAALDLNASNASQFVILKEGNKYAGIILNNSDVLIP